MPEKRFVITCRECTHFKPFADQEYGECTRKMFRGAIVKETDFCSYAELPIPDIDDHDKSGDLVKDTDYCSRGKERDDEKDDI